MAPAVGIRSDHESNTFNNLGIIEFIVKRQVWYTASQVFFSLLKYHLSNSYAVNSIAVRSRFKTHTESLEWGFTWAHIGGTPQWRYDYFYLVSGVHEK